MSNHVEIIQNEKGTCYIATSRDMIVSEGRLIKTPQQELDSVCIMRKPSPEKPDAEFYLVKDIHTIQKTKRGIEIYGTVLMSRASQFESHAPKLDWFRSELKLASKPH